MGGGIGGTGQQCHQRGCSSGWSKGLHPFHVPGPLTTVSVTAQLGAGEQETGRASATEEQLQWDSSCLSCHPSALMRWDFSVVAEMELVFHW